MHILFVAPTAPIPTSGGRTRFHNLIKQLADRHEISVLSFIQPDEYDQLQMIKPSCQIIETVPFAAFAPLDKWQNRLQGWRQILSNPRPRYALTFPVDDLRAPLREMLAAHSFDLVVLQSLYVVELVDEVGEIPVILATENVESDIARQDLANARNGVHRIRDWLLWKKLRRFETEWLQRFTSCIAVSDSDARTLQSLSPHTGMFVVPNGVDTAAFAPSASSREADQLLFFGSLSYGPNAHGVVWFCEEVLPLVRAEIPEVRLAIVGLNPPERVKALGSLPGVEMVGFLPDIRTALWSATTSVVPLHAGGGTRLKILESLAAECPVVSTTIGAESLDLINGQHLVIADTADAFGQAVIRLLRDPDLRNRLAQQGARAVAQQYDWHPISIKLEHACARAVQLHGSTAHEPA